VAGVEAVAQEARAQPASLARPMEPGQGQVVGVLSDRVACGVRVRSLSYSHQHSHLCQTGPLKRKMVGGKTEDVPAYLSELASPALVPSVSNYDKSVNLAALPIPPAQ